MRSDTQATVVLNIGADSTDLVVCTKSDVWQRAIPMGGSAFTKSIAETFKLNFERAEKLKRTAPMSKYARQILQAMKPVFTDLAAEIQRSLGFYTSSHTNVKLSRVIAMGGGTKMRGLLQYLQQSLQMPIERPDAFKQLAINPAVSAAKFHENVADFAVVYGLAVQALGHGRITCNLLPHSVAKSMAWATKNKYFAAAACLVLVVGALALARVFIDEASYQNKRAVRDKIKATLEEAKGAEEGLKAEKNKAAVSEATIKKELEIFKYRDVLPLVYSVILEELPNEKNNPGQAELYRAFAERNVQKVKEFKRDQRKQIFVTSMSIYYAANLADAQFETAGFKRSIGQTDNAAAGAGDARAYFEMMGMSQPGGPGSGGKGGSGRPKAAPAAAASAESAAERGFVVSISGYSPYADIGEMLDPSGAHEDQSKWGFVTRLAHLEMLFDSNSPFELYKKTDKKNFEISTGEVNLTGEIPAGIGVRKSIEQKGGATPEDVLVDPMTKEIISRVAVVDEGGKNAVDRHGNPIYQVNDHWFVLNFKLRWKDAPAMQELAAAVTPGSHGGGGATVAPVAPAPAARSSKPKESSGGGRKKSGGGGGGDF